MGAGRVMRLRRVSSTEPTPTSVHPAGAMRPATPPAPAKNATVSISIPAAMNEALAHYNAGRLGPAGRIAAEIIAARPGRADAHNLMGAILSAKGDREGAAASFGEAARLEPDNALFLANLGEAARQRGNLEAALDALRRAVALDAHSAQAFNNLGIVRFDRREFEEAVRVYENAIANDDSYPEAHNNLGNALRALGRNDDAVEAYQSALLLRENYPEAYNNLARHPARPGELRRGRALLSQGHRAPAGLPRCVRQPRGPAGRAEA